LFPEGRHRPGEGQENATATNQRRAGQRQALESATEAARASVAHNRVVRAERVNTMTPDQVADADASRDALLADQARHRRLVRQQQQARQATEWFRAPPIDRGGPGIER